MTDIFSEASKEMQEKSPFLCTSCGHPHEIARVRAQLMGKSNTAFHDEFSEAVEEEGKKSAFKCESCGHSQTLN